MYEQFCNEELIKMADLAHDSFPLNEYNAAGFFRWLDSKARYIFKFTTLQV